MAKEKTVKPASLASVRKELAKALKRIAELEAQAQESESY